MRSVRSVMEMRSKGHLTGDCAAMCAGTHGGDDLVLITISGHPGSGTSTLVHLLCDRRGWTSLNGGDVFRTEAAGRGLPLEEFSRLCRDEPEVDRTLDDRLRHAMQVESGPEVIESRLAGWWANQLELDCIKVWLEVSTAERARRIVEREGGELSAALERMNERMAADALRYDLLYSISLEDMSPYNLQLHTDSMQPDEVADTVETALDSQGD